MALKLTPVGVLGKWVIAPAALLLLGYFVVGPKIGRAGTKTSSKAAEESSAPPNADPASTPPQITDAKPKHKKKSVADGPDVDVTVQPADTDKPSAPPSEGSQDTPAPVRKPRHKPVVKDEETQSLEAPRKKKPVSPPDDEGGSAGSTTAG